MAVKYKKEILETIFKKIERDDCIVFLFGTHAQGEAIFTSDIDIGILSNEPILPKNFLEAQEGAKYILANLEEN